MTVACLQHIGSKFVLALGDNFYWRGVQSDTDPYRPTPPNILCLYTSAMSQRIHPFLLHGVTIIVSRHFTLSAFAHSSVLCCRPDVHRDIMAFFFQPLELGQCPPSLRACSQHSLQHEMALCEQRWQGYGDARGRGEKHATPDAHCAWPPQHQAAP